MKKYCFLEFKPEEELALEATRNTIRSAIKKGFHRLRNKCQNQFKSHVPIVRRQIVDLQIVWDNIIADAHNRRLYHQNLM